MSRVKPLKGWDRMTGKRQQTLRAGERFSHPEETAMPRDGRSATTKGHQREDETGQRSLRHTDTRAKGDPDTAVAEELKPLPG